MGMGIFNANIALAGGLLDMTRLRKRVGQEVVLENGDDSFTPFC